MKVLIGAIFIGVGLVVLHRMATREHNPVAPGQALIDFATGAPRESVLAVGAIIFGLIWIAAQFV